MIGYANGLRAGEGPLLSLAGPQPRRNEDLRFDGFSGDFLEAHYLQHSEHGLWDYWPGSKRVRAKREGPEGSGDKSCFCLDRLLDSASIAKWPYYWTQPSRRKYLKHEIWVVYIRSKGFVAMTTLHCLAQGA